MLNLREVEIRKMPNNDLLLFVRGAGNLWRNANQGDGAVDVKSAAEVELMEMCSDGKGECTLAVILFNESPKRFPVTGLESIEFVLSEAFAYLGIYQKAWGV